MRRTISLLCFSLITAACSDPCSRETKAAFIGLGGPVGILVAALEQCEAATPTPQPIAAVVAPGLAVPEQRDMATPTPDMASPTPDLTVPPDLTPPPPPPPDLSPVTVQVELAPWQASGPVTATSSTTYHVVGAFDFAKGRATPGNFEIPVTLPPEARSARSILLSYSISAGLTWGPTSSTCAAQGVPSAYLVKSGATTTCLRGSVGAGLVIDGNSTDPLRNTMPQQLNAMPQPGTQYPVSTTSKVALRLQLQGDVDVFALAGKVFVTLEF